MTQDVGLEDVCRVVGYAATRSIEVWYPGRYLWVPRRVQADHPLALLLGPGVLRALAEAFGGERVQVPAESSDAALRRDRRIAEALATGQPVAAIAAGEGITGRRVEQIRDELLLRGWLAYAESGRRAVVVAAAAAPCAGTGEVARDAKNLERAASHAR